MIVHTGKTIYMGGRANTLINEYERITRALRGKLLEISTDDEVRNAMMAAIRIGFTNTEEEKLEVMKELGIEVIKK